jgi:hypothetical protein
MGETLTSPGRALDQTLADMGEPGALPGALATGSARYARGRELGRGGMGRVCEAVDQQFKRIVAIKEVSAREPSEAALRRFTTEAIVTGHLEHPGIPTVYERGADDTGRPFYAMRRVEGRTFAKLLVETAGLDDRLALLPVVLRVAQTIGFAHDRGVVHRDIKPENVIVGSHGETVVLDWGLARVRGVPTEVTAGSLPAEPGVTLYGSAVGTPAYMAPEQARGDLELVDERSDVFALGGLLYHLLAGHPPYTGGTAREILDAARDSRSDPLELAAPRAPAALVAICQRALGRDPATRYRDAHELAGALEGFQAEAVRGKPSRAIELGANVVGAAAVAVLLAAIVAVTRVVSSLHAQGLGGTAVVAFGAAGSLVLAVEWATRRRYRLSSLGLALAVSTFLGAVAGFASGASKTFGAVVQDDALIANARATREVVLSGLYESAGLVATGAILAAFQLVLWAVAQRRGQ